MNEKGKQAFVYFHTSSTLLSLDPSLHIRSSPALNTLAVASTLPARRQHTPPFYKAEPEDRVRISFQTPAGPDSTCAGSIVLNFRWQNVVFPHEREKNMSVVYSMSLGSSGQILLVKETVDFRYLPSARQSHQSHNSPGDSIGYWYRQKPRLLPTSELVNADAVARLLHCAAALVPYYCRHYLPKPRPPYHLAYLYPLYPSRTCMFDNPSNQPGSVPGEALGGSCDMTFRPVAKSVEY
ncbi:hypothetical protein ACRALDRAFT_213213 [Sodiomyces alcalophilus JCM 7366]|uniref:uncharacterized protein n=1 Tax=Sodiomyces alcalophilus JCM 7366 TaxID=591952 RepID=UPI0039B5DE6D